MKSEYKKIICNRINELIKEYNLTAEKLAFQSGISKSGLSEILSCKKLPSSFTIVKICSGFGISPKDFYNFREIENFIEKF